MRTPRCAFTSHGGRTRAISLMESHDRIAAQGPGPGQAGQGRKPAAPVVHSASLDGLRRSQRRGSRSWLCACCVWGRNARGAHSLDCSMSCANRYAVMLSRTLRQLSDLFVLFCRPTVPHAAAFILPSLGRRSAPVVPARSFAKLRSDKNQTKHLGSRFRAGSLRSLRRLVGGRMCVMCRRVG
jgi:hypothetical protein